MSRVSSVQRMTAAGPSPTRSRTALVAVAALTVLAMSIYGPSLQAIAAEPEGVAADLAGAVSPDATAHDVLVDGLGSSSEASIALDGLLDEPALATDGIAASGDVLTIMPTPGDPSVDLYNAEREATLSVSIPDAETSATSDLATTLTASEDEAYVVQATDLGGAQIINVASQPTSEHSFTLETEVPEGATWAATESGSLELTDADGTLLAVADAPWSVDANGSSLPTEFTIDGTTITQHVDTSDAVFPVTSDPSLWWVIGSAAVCAAEIASLAVGAARIVAAFAKADRIVKSARAVVSAYNALGGTMAKVVNYLKKYVKNKNSLTRAQKVALEKFVSEVGKTVFNIIGLGSCYSLATTR